jgi:predicted phage tail protein
MLKAGIAIGAAVVVIAAFFMGVYGATPSIALLAIGELGAMLLLAGGVAWATARRANERRVRELSTRRTGRGRAP